MTKPRITLTFSKPGKSGTPSISLYLNPAGRDLLVQQLCDLTEQNEHFHLQDEKWTIDIPLRQIAYNPAEETVIEDAKILLRLDEWDRQYFPHVMTDVPND